MMCRWVCWRSTVGFKKHGTLKCHTCKRKLPLTGGRTYESARASGWTLVRQEQGHWVQLCPACSRRRAIQQAKVP
jgi:hypothetical protein